MALQGVLYSKEKAGFMTGPQHGNIPETASFGEALARAKTIARARQIATNSCDVTGQPALIGLERHATGSLMLSFGGCSGNFFSLSGQNIEAHIAQGLLPRMTYPAHISTRFSDVASMVAYQHSPQRRQDIITGLVQNYAPLRGFTQDDARALTRGTADQQAAVRERFAAADEAVLRITAHTMMDIRAGNRTDRDALTALLGAARDTPDYSAWEAQRRAEVLSRVRGDAMLMADISKIKSPFNLIDAADARAQLEIKERVAKRLTRITADVYGHQTLSEGDTHVVLQTADTMRGGYAAKSITIAPGIAQDETIIIRENPVLQLLSGCALEATDRGEARAFVRQALEELQHTSDDIHGDALMRGRLPAEHPAARHAVLWALNMASYTENHRAYNEQFVERTAKEGAEALTRGIFGDPAPGSLRSPAARNTAPVRP